MKENQGFGVGSSAIPNRVKGSHVVSSWNSMALYLAYCLTYCSMLKNFLKK